jgi:hypothetical protein
LFSLGPPVYPTNKADHHDITEQLLKVAIHTIKQTNKQLYLGIPERVKLCVLFLAIIWDWNILLTVREITSMKNVKNE